MCKGGTFPLFLPSGQRVKISFSILPLIQLTSDPFSDPSNPSGSGYFQIAPTLSVGKENGYLPLDSIQCITHLSKLLGPFPEWEGRLRVAKETGYNMIHLTPVQELGTSGSSYSIANQCVLEPSQFRLGDKNYGFPELKEMVSKFRDEWYTLTICDVVWNHTAHNSPWLQVNIQSF